MISLIVLVIELLVIFILKSLGVLSIDSMDSITVICIFSLAYIISVLTSKKTTFFRIQLILAYFARIAMLCLDVFGRSLYTLPHSGNDSENFYNNAVRYADGRIYWDTVTVKTLGTLMKLFGCNRLLIQFLLMLLSIFTIHIVLSILDMLSVSSKGKSISMWFLAIVPNYMILSSLFLRESIIVLFVALSLWLFVMWWERRGEIFYILAIATVFLGAIYHSGVVGIALGYIGVRFLYDRKKKRYRLSVYSVVVALLSMLAVTFLFNNYASLMFAKMQNIDDITDISSNVERGNSSYTSIAGNSDTVLNFIFYSPLRIILFLFTPLPFQIRGLSDIIAMVFSAWLYLWIVFRGLKFIIKKKKNSSITVALIIIIMVTSFIFGWGSTNIGTNIRHRDKMIPLFSVVLAISYDSISTSKGKDELDAIN